MSLAHDGKEESDGFKKETSEVLLECTRISVCSLAHARLQNGLLHQALATTLRVNLVLRLEPCSPGPQTAWLYALALRTFRVCLLCALKPNCYGRRPRILLCRFEREALRTPASRLCFRARQPIKARIYIFHTQEASERRCPRAPPPPYPWVTIRDCFVEDRLNFNGVWHGGQIHRGWLPLCGVWPV